MCGDYFVSYAITEKEIAELEKQTNATLSKNVKFDAYFTEDENNKIHHTVSDVNNEETMINLELNVVEEGYLKDAVITLKTEDENEILNYNIKQINDEQNMVQSKTINAVYLRQVDKDEDVKLNLNIVPNLGEEKTSKKIINQSNIVSLEGTYIDEKGREVPIKKDINLNIGWTGEFKAKTNIGVEKYIPLNIDNNKRVLTQFYIKTGLEETEKTMPIEKTEINIEIPELNGIKPEKIDVIAKATKATNGLNKNKVIFSEENWTKDDKTGTISIKVENKEDEDGNIALGSGEDEYILTCIYPEKAYDEVQSRNANFKFNVETKIKIYNIDEEITRKDPANWEISEPVGRLLSLEGNSQTEKIGKGKMYANINSSTKDNETEYEAIWNINVGYKEKLEEIKLQDEKEELVSANGQTYDISAYTMYKQLIVNKASFMQTLGEEGTITIYNKEGEFISSINKNTTLDENGDFVINYYEKLPQLVIQTSKPIAEGNLVITSKKAIGGELNLSKSQIENINKIVITNSLSQKEEGESDYLKIDEQEVEIDTEETQTRARLTMDRDNLSTVVNNENVEFKIELGNNTDKSDLYIDPVFDIEFPSYVRDVNVKETKILYDDELIITNIEKLQNSNGNIVIRLTLDGIQTKFSEGSITNGTNIVVRTDIALDILTPKVKDQIKMYYYNKNTKNFDNPVQTSIGMAGLSMIDIEYSAPTGLLSISNWSDFDNTGRSQMSVNQGTKVEQIGIYQPTKISKMNLILVNNTGNMCDGITVLGRIPFEGNKTVLTGENLGTTIDTNLRSAIQANGIDSSKVKIYYSENGEATKDLSDRNNGWSDNVSDITKIKSFLIVINDYQMQAGEKIDFSYNLELSDNMSYNNNIFSNFATFYTENSIQANLLRESESDPVGVTTGIGPNLKVEQEVTGAREDWTVNPESLLKYTIKITNDGTTEAKNVVIKDKIPKWTKYVKSFIEGNTDYDMVQEFPWYNKGLVENGMLTETEWNITKEMWNVIDEGDVGNNVPPTVGWTIETIKPGETITKEIEIATQELPDILTYYKDFKGFTVKEDGKYYMTTTIHDPETDTDKEVETEITHIPDIEIVNEIEITAENYDTVTKSESKTITVVEKVATPGAKIEATETVSQNTQGSYKVGDEITYTIVVKNSFEDEKDINIEKILPEGLEYNSASLYLIDAVTGDQDVFEAKYDTNTRKITAKAEKIGKNDTLTLMLKVKVGMFNNGTYENEINTNSKIIASDGTVVNTETTKLTVKKPKLKLTAICTNESQYLNEKDIVEYKIVVENIGEVDANNIMVQQYIPKELEFISGKYTMNVVGTELSLDAIWYEEESLVYAVSGVAVGNKFELTVKAKALALSEDTTISSKVKVSGDSIDGLESTIENMVEKSKNPSNGNNGGNTSGGNTGENPVVIKNKVSGLAFLDENENGSRESEEKLLEGITVLLIDNSTGEIAKSANGEEQKTKTDINGNYIFSNVTNGSYIVVFQYDTAVYTVTQYQQSGVRTIQNSDAIEKEIVLNEQTILAGVTNTINVEKSVSNIDLGLVTREKFDLKLDKTVTKVTVQNKKGIKTHEYNDVKLAQIPIKGKELANSTIIVEYKIKITNEGNIPGYAKSIVDYMPKDLSFNSNLNPNWYLGNDNNVYTTALEKQLISPGESKEISLVLTKKLTENSTGLINNTAEINESYNERGIKDRDSTAGNRNQGEDDQSLADILIAISTGGTVIAISFSLILVLVAVAIGIYYLRKKEKLIK